MKTTNRRSATAIRVVLVDDHELLLEALGAALARCRDIEVVGVAGSIRELRELQVGRPDVVLMDYHLLDGTGADGCRLVKARWPRVRVVMLSGVGDHEAVLESLTSGADGFLVKSVRDRGADLLTVGEPSAQEVAAAQRDLGDGFGRERAARQRDAAIGWVHVDRRRCAIQCQ